MLECVLDTLNMIVKYFWIHLNGGKNIILIA